MAVKNVLFKIQADTAQLRKELDSVRAQLGQLNQTADKAQGGFSKLKGALSGAAAAFGGIQIAGAALNFGKGALDAVTSYESLNISFETFLGNAEQAKKTLAELESFSAATPFTSEQVSNAGKALLAFGEPVDNLAVTLERLGDVSSATGKDFNELAVIYGKARVQGTLFAEDINQLTEAGVPIIDEFAKQFGVSTSEVKKLGSEGKISFANLEEGFRSLTSEGGRFFGLTDKLGQSTAGRISTLEDNFKKLQRSIGEGLLPVFEFLIDTFSEAIEGVRQLPEFLDRNKASITLLTGALGVYAALQTRSYQIQLADYAIKIKNLIVDRAKVAITSIQNGLTAAQTALTSRQAAATALQATATRGAAAAQTALNTAWKLNPVGLVIGALTTIAAAFFAFSDSADEAVDSTQQLSLSQQALADIQTETNKAVATETVELNRLFGALKNTNAGSSERAELIDQINSKYGTTLKNLKDEEAFVRQVDAAYQALIQSITDKARAEAGSRVLQGVIEKDIQARTYIQNSITELAKVAKSNPIVLSPDVDLSTLSPRLRIVAEEYRKLDAERRTAVQTLAKQEAAAIKQQEDQFNKVAERGDATYNQQSARIRQVQQALDESAQTEFSQTSAEVAANYQSAANSFLQLTEEQQKLIDESDFPNAFEFFIAQAIEANKATKEIENTVKNLQTTTSKTTTGGAAAAPKQTEAEKLNEKRKKELQDLRKEAEKLQEELKKGTTTFIDPVTSEDQLNQINDLAKLQQEATDKAFDERKARLKEELQITDENNQLIVELEGIRQLEKTKIAQDTEKAIQDLQLKTKEETDAALNEIEQTKFDIQLQLELENIKKLEDEKAKLRKQYGEAQTKAERERIKKLIDQNLLDLKGAYAREFKLNTDKITSQTKFDLNNAKLTSTQKQGIQLKADLSLLKLKQDYTQKDVAITQEGSDEKKAIDESEKKQIIKNIEETTQAAFNLAKALIDAAIAQSEAQIKAQEERVEKAAEIADKGNAEILELEQNKLDQLRKQRERYVKQQQALAVLEIAANAAIAIAKTAAETGVLSPAFIASTLAAMAIGFAQARAQAQSAASFARGGYTGDGSKFEAAGTVHRGEFVMNAERTRQYRPMLEAMHAGRNPKLLNGLQEKLLVVNSRSSDERLERIERAIREQQGMQLSIDERGIHGIVSRLDYKQQRIKRKAR